MNTTEFEKRYNTKLTLKKKSKFMRLVGFFLGRKFMEEFWTTFRLPFQKKATITFPDSDNFTKYKEIPQWALDVLDHELVHVKDMSTPLGLFKMFWLVWLAPLPIFFSGRWYIEFPAYMNDIIKGRKTVEESVEILWNSYGWCWPKPLMRKKFYKCLKEYKNGNTKKS